MVFKKWTISRVQSWIFSLPLFLVTLSSVGQALELDWSGQFWSEFNFVHNYSVGTTNSKTGYSVTDGGSQDATFESLFLRVRPKVIVNDNIYIKSEWWVGDPIYGIFGSGAPYSADQRQYYSSQSRGSLITAQRVWGEFLSDIGTFQVGRVPLHWGLGIVWNSGENLWARYMSSGDGIRWIAKFGAFSFIPSLIVNNTGNTIGGACSVTATGGCTPGGGSGGVTDYSLILKYENPEDDLEGGINFIKRIGGSNPDPSSGVVLPGGTTTSSMTGSMNYITYDIYAKKKLSQLTLGAEVPITTGQLGPSTYSSFAIAGELDWKVSDGYEALLKSGYASGQTNLSSASIDTYRAFYFNPNYHIGMIMFNYQLANFAGPQTTNNPSLNQLNLASPYDNPIVNALYFSLANTIHAGDKWSFKPALVYAVAPQSASNGNYFFNYWTRRVEQNTSGRDQGRTLGLEFDLGINFQWDEYFQISLDNGFFFPGNFYAFSNSPSGDNGPGAVWASSVRVGVNF